MVKEELNKNPSAVRFIADHYLTMTDEAIGKVLGYARETINIYRRRHNLYKTAVPAAKDQEPAVGDLADKGVSAKILSDARDKAAVTMDATLDSLTPRQRESVLRKRVSLELKKMVPPELFEDASRKLIDKFVLIRADFNDIEWSTFVSHWMRYMQEHDFDFNSAEDFDDLVGMIRELIIQSRVFSRSKDATTQFDDRAYDNSVSRMKQFRQNLDMSRKRRLESRVDDRGTITEIINLFDAEENRRILKEADVETREELMGFLDKVRKRVSEEVGDGSIQGNESALLLGMSDNIIEDMFEKGNSILDEKKKEA